MSIGMSVTVEGPPGGGEGRGPVTVGWLLAETAGGVLFDAPRRVRADAGPRTHAKAASACPAVLNLESRMFEVSCPFDLTLEFARSDLGAPAVRNSDGAMAPVRDGMLDHLVVVSPEEEWRHPDRPVLQLRLPYIFVSDEPVYMAQIPPFQHFAPDPVPGVMISGRLPIHLWPRTLSWAFEWHDIGRPLILRRGTPLFNVLFETVPQTRPVQLVEAERTPELSEYLDQITGVVNYVNQTFTLFKAAEERRPARLVVPKERT